MPIGMLDSGVGGFSVLREVRTLLPHEPILYFADEGHLPYGPRSREQIRTFVDAIARFLREQGCDLIVIACNTANAAALHDLRDRMPDFPIVGMEPAVKPAAEHTRSGVIGVLSTKVTNQSELFASVVDRFAQHVHVEARVCPDFVLLVERGAPHNAESARIIAENLESLKTSGADQIVLACTHFPFLTDQIQAYFGPDTTIIDPAPAVARQVKRVMGNQPALTDAPGLITYFTSGDVAHFAWLRERLISVTTGEIIPVTWRGETQVILS
jgi:glutamate racemase